MLPTFDLTGTIAVVIDIFRATSSICYGLANGASAIIPVAQVAECLAYRDQGFLLAAERDGRVVEGFDFGNSPFSYTADRVKGKTVVLTTTNGTRAIQLCHDAQHIVIGSFANIDALSDWLQARHEDIVLVCSGWKDHVNLEDTLFAGAVVARLEHETAALDDAARLALSLYGAGKKDLSGFLQNASHTQRMQRLDVGRDVEFCLQENTSPVVPYFRNGKLVDCLGENFDS